MIPSISICIPVYNGAKWLRGCLDSACATAMQVEIIVCDDRSSDNSLAIAREYALKDARIKVFQNEQNFGLVGNWNKCIELSSREWIKFLFQDDRLHPDALENMFAAATPGVKLIAAKRNYVFGDNSSPDSIEYYTKLVTTLDKVASGVRNFPAKKISELCARNIAINFIGEPSTVMFHRSVISEIGQFDTAYKQICDLEFWARIATVHGLLYVPEAVIDFNVHDDSESAKNANEKKSGTDSLRFVHALCYNANYKTFRNHLGFFSWQLLVLWLRVHAYEARITHVIEANPAMVKLFAENQELMRESEKFGNKLLFSLLR